MRAAIPAELPPAGEADAIVLLDDTVLSVTAGRQSPRAIGAS